MISKIIEISFPEGACAMMSVSQVEHALKHILEERADVLARETHEMRNEFALGSRTGVRGSFLALTLARGTESSCSLHGR
jgi:hypothetical protein